MRSDFAYAYSFYDDTKKVSNFCLRCKRCGQELLVEAKTEKEARKQCYELHSECSNGLAGEMFPSLAFAAMVLLLIGRSVEPDKLSYMVCLFFKSLRLYFQ